MRARDIFMTPSRLPEDDASPFFAALRTTAVRPGGGWSRANRADLEIEPCLEFR